MNSDQIIKYTDTHFKNIVDNKIKAFEQSVIKYYNFEKTYKLKNPILQNILQLMQLKNLVTN